MVNITGGINWVKAQIQEPHGYVVRAKEGVGVPCSGAVFDAASKAVKDYVNSPQAHYNTLNNLAYASAAIGRAQAIVVGGMAGYRIVEKYGNAETSRKAACSAICMTGRAARSVTGTPPTTKATPQETARFYPRLQTAGHEDRPQPGRRLGRVPHRPGIRRCDERIDRSESADLRRGGLRSQCAVRRSRETADSNACRE